MAFQQSAGSHALFLPWPSPQITQAGQDGSQCGIGVVFRMDNHGALVVDSLVPGGPAWESSTQGGLQVSDVLQTVDGKNVYRCRTIPPSPLSAALFLGHTAGILDLGHCRAWLEICDTIPLMCTRLSCHLSPHTGGQ